MKASIILSLFLFVILFSCNQPKAEKESSTIIIEEPKYQLTASQAETLLELPLACVQTEYPNKLGQTLLNDSHLGSPTELHPAFYGCFDWHSSVHGHWSMVKLVKEFPDLPKAAEAKQKLMENITKENIAKEIDYFKRETEKSYERTYGWAWLLKLQQELNSWDTETGKTLAANLQPLTDLIVARYETYLPKLAYPIRVGEHTNSAFGMSFAYDYAVASGNETLKASIEKRAKDFYLTDKGCPLDWEPSGYDFLSPCFEEIDIMRKVLPQAEFDTWMADFMPQLKESTFDVAVGEVSDRKDGKMVHLDGLNYSRAWVMYGLANQYPEYAHLRNSANKHMEYSFPNLVGDSYEGSHWLGSFAIYALSEQS